jgi:hypothetical protein
MSKPLLILGSLLSLPFSSSAFAAKPEFHSMLIPPGKSARDVKPRLQARADEPVVLELRAHRHADGSLHFECDHEHPTPAGSQTNAEEETP